METKETGIRDTPQDSETLARGFRWNQESSPERIAEEKRRKRKKYLIG